MYIRNTVDVLIPFALVLAIALLLAYSQASSGLWVSLQQVAMGDAFLRGGFAALYPDPAAAEIYPASPYFPGVALLSAGLSALIPPSIYEPAFLLVACLCFLAFSLLACRLTRQEKLYPALAFTLLSSVTLLRPFAIYAGQFKPDTISLLFGLSGLLLLFTGKHRLLRFGVAPLVFSLGILFKQQFVFFEAGIGLAALAYARSGRRDLLLFTAISAGWTSFILLAFNSIPHLYYHTVLALSDDDRLGIVAWWTLNRALLAAMAIFLLLLCMKPATFREVGYRRDPQLLAYLSGSLCHLFGSLLSSLKDGGDDGNTALGLALLLPLLYRHIHPLPAYKWAALCVYGLYFFPAQLSYAIDRRHAATEYEHAFLTLAARQPDASAYIDVNYYNAVRRAGITRIHDGRTARWTGTGRDHTRSDALLVFATAHRPDFILHATSDQMGKAWAPLVAGLRQAGYELVMMNGYGSIFQRRD